MSALISPPKAPPVKKAPPPPERSSDEIAQAAATQRTRIYGSSAGRVSTMLSPFGTTGNATGATVKLLGGTSGV